MTRIFRKEGGVATCPRTAPLAPARTSHAYSSLILSQEVNEHESLERTKCTNVGVQKAA